MYKVKYGGKKGKTIALVESPDLVAIRTKNNETLENVEMSSRSRELVADSAEVVAFPEAGVTVRRVADTEGLESSGQSRRDEARACLKQEENILFAGRVLQDAETGEVTLYTENFFVKFKDGTAEKDCLALLEKYQLKVKNKLPFAPNAYFVSANAGTGLQVFHIAEQLLKEKRVEYCHPELVQERRFKGIHPLQWHLAKTSISDKPVEAHINIEAAWKRTKGKGITIAVIDDGIEIDHPEFAKRVVHPFDATANNNDPRPKDAADKHGTPCAGMACAAGLKNGASGTAPEAFLLPIRLRSGLGSMAEANAFAWAADHGADVISCSWGPSDGEWWNPEDPVHKKVTALPDSTRLALEYALTKGRAGKGCVVLFAAGNGNEDIQNDGYCSYPGVIAVAACNDTGRRSVYSDFGRAVWVSFPSGDFGWKPFRHAPPISQGLRTTDRLKKAGYDAGDYTNSFGGTSGACPGMAGVVALMLAANPNLTPPEIKDIIRRSCQKIDAAEGDYQPDGHSPWYGYGRIDAGLAVANALEAARQPALPIVEGTVRFSAFGEQRLQPSGMLTGVFQTPEKLLGFALRLRGGDKNLRLRYRANMPGRGIVENRAEGEFVGTANGRQRVIGFALQLEGSTASQYSIEYSAQIQGSTGLQSARDGLFCGSDKKTGKTVQAIAVRLVPR
jgi:subtilisin family serine protease